jgi:hypothetical protein
MSRTAHSTPRRYRGPEPGQQAYDMASERFGILQAIHRRSELLFAHRLTAERIAFLRPLRGGVEWLADADDLRIPTDVPTASRTPGPRVPVLIPEMGERLPRPAYKADFRQRTADLHHQKSWKLERRQHFEEQDNASWDAVRRGDWAEALRLLEEERGTLLAVAEEDARRGYVFHRVRVVEQPLTPYMQWELHALRISAEYRENIRVLQAHQVAAEERSHLLPEVVVLGGRTLYHVLYTAEGVPNGAIRFTDPDIVEPWEDYIKALYDEGENVASYVDRTVAHLPPPTAPGPGRR